MLTLSAAFLASACFGFAPPNETAATPQLVLSDPGYTLWEIRPLDRRVYVLTLEGDWKSPPDRNAAYYVHIEFPDGGGVEQRVIDDRLFRRGDVEALLIEYQWDRHHFRRGDRLTLFVTRRGAGGAPDVQEAVSNRLEVEWPFDRKVTRLPPRTRFTPPEPIDSFHPQGDKPAPPRPAVPSDR